jgi:hypothetical protein
VRRAHTRLLLAACAALAGATLATGVAAAGLPKAEARHCRELRFSERLRAHGTGCDEARFVARRAVRHITSDSDDGWRIDMQVHGRRGRVWNCRGSGFNPLPLACRRPGSWIKLQVWGD